MCMLSDLWASCCSKRETPSKAPPNARVARRSTSRRPTSRRAPSPDREKRHRSTSRHHRSTSVHHDPEKRRSTHHTPRTSKNRMSSSEATSGGPSRRRSKTVTSASTNPTRRPRSYSTTTDERRRKPVTVTDSRDAAFQKLSSQAPVKRRRSKLRRSRSNAEKSDLQRRHTTLEKDRRDSSRRRHRPRARSHSPTRSSSSPSRRRTAAEAAASGGDPVTVRSMRQRRSGYNQHVPPQFPSPQTGEIHGAPDLRVENIPALAAWALRERVSTSDTGSSVRKRRASVGFTYRTTTSDTLPSSQSEFHAHLVSHLTSVQLSHLIPSNMSTLHHISTLASTSSPIIARSLELPAAATQDLTILGLYDIYLLLDNSTSMNTPSRWPSLVTATHHITALASRYNPNGLTIRFLHHAHDAGFNGIATEPQVDTTLASATPAPGTALGTAAFEKLVAPLAAAGARVRPALLLLITDGIVDREPAGRFGEVVVAAQGLVGRDMVRWAVCVVGRDGRMREWCEGLRRDREVRRACVVAKEGIEKVVESAESVGELNTWLTQMMAAAVKR